MAAVGDRIDRFTLVRRLGAGGMGETWEAVRQAGHEFEQRVAIKLAGVDVLNSTDGLDSFRREAALAASLRHPNIAGVLDVDAAGGYIVCELVDGADLRSVLKAAPSCRLSSPVLIHVLGQIARGLSHAHRRVLRGVLSPVIHRDMSPGNVVVDYDGNVKIVDFGIAKTMLGGSDVAEAIKGKLSYMAPEQAMGARMDGRADQYALGVIAYEALTAVRPNDGANEGETLASILSAKHVPLAIRAPWLDAGLVAVIERMLAVHPEQRFASLDAVLEALAPFTPSFIAYRDLIPLVMAARQPHTILRENGRFVSRPVEPILHLHAATPLASAPAASAQPDVRSQRAELLAAVSGEAQAAASTLERADAAEVLAAPRSAGAARNAAAVDYQSRTSQPQPRHAAKRAQSKVRATRSERSEPRRSGKASTEPADRRGLADAPRSGLRMRVRHGLDAVLASRAFWHSLTLVGAALLALVAWLAFSPDLLLSLAPGGLRASRPITTQLSEPSTLPDARGPQPPSAATTSFSH
jgi:serine/threonine protein kinase